MGSLRATSLVTLALLLGVMNAPAQAQFGAAFGDLSLSADPLLAQPYNENIAGFENVANLDLLPESGAFVLALPMKIEGGSGGPLRIVAFVPAGVM